MNRPGFLAIGFAEAPGIDGEIRRALEECGAPHVKLESIAAGGEGERRILAFAETSLWAELPAAQARNPTPVLAHVHVPKCAGTSFRVLQERYFGARHLSLYIDDTYFLFTQEALRGYLLQNPEAQGFSSHHVRVFPQWLAGREVLYVTFLRDPIQQFVSYMTHIKKHYATITAKSLLEAVPPDTPHLTLREFARWLLIQDRDIPFRENHNVNFFARHSAPRAEDRLAAAKAALETFFFVGITERMEESMGKLRALARKADLEFPPGSVPVENTSADYRDDLSWINPDDEVGSLLLGSVEKDRQLYDWAVARLDRMAL
jgi:sulfotransferase famil protein